MKKILKSILALTLSFIMAFGTLTAFAAEGDTITWAGGWWDIEYQWTGEAKLGKNTVSYNEDFSSVYLDFNAESAGYYLISYDTSVIDWAGFPEKIDGTKVAGESYINYVYDNDIITIISKLDAGKTYLGIDYYNSEVTSADITLDYLGDAITDIVIDESSLDDLVDEYDIFCEFEEGRMYADIEVLFSSGKKVKFEETIVDFKCENFADGENTVVVVFDGFEKEVVVNVSSIKDIVKSAELSNYENYTTITYDYEGYGDASYISGETVTVTYSDGSTYNVPIEYGEGFAIFPNGREYPVMVDYFYNDDHVLALTVLVGDVTYGEYECVQQDAGIIDNIGSLNDYNNNSIASFFNNIIYYLERVTHGESLIEIFEYLREFFFDSFIAFSNLSNRLFSNIMYFFKYYLAAV